MPYPPLNPLSRFRWILIAIVLNGCMCHDPNVLRSLAIDQPEPDGLTSEPAVGPGECIDADGDGYGTGPGCFGPDCDDGDATFSTSGERRCYTGPDGTEGIGSCGAGVERCVAGVLSACEGQTTPAAETCDGADNDCDGEVDGELTRRCYSGPTGTQNVGACVSGTQTCTGGAYTECAGEAIPTAETCDGVDNDCDGEVDESISRACYTGPSGTAGVGACVAGTQACTNGSFGACTGEVVPTAEVCDGSDNDCDGQVDEALVRACYSGPTGTQGVGACMGGSQTCTAGTYGACVGEVTPSAETCDAVDNDCDGSVDENITRVCYSGAPGTENVGACVTGTQTCSAGAFGSCVGEVTPATEVCDAVDNDCDGSVDEALVRTCYNGPIGTAGVGACASGTQTCSAGAYGSCGGEITPAEEICDAVDNDCDGQVDEAIVRACYSGPSGTDGVGACVGGNQTCTAGAFGACVSEVTPSAELCDAIDNDCDGEVDEDVVRACYTGPGGTEGVGACVGGTQTCSAGAFGACAGEVTPAAEVCDAVDNDCDGSVDEALVRTCYSGPSGTEGVGACAAGTQTCSAGGYGACAGDVIPSTETCDAIDNDCDGSVDEEIVRACYTGPGGTEGVGACVGGSQTCSAGVFGTCAGEVTPTAEVCDAVDNDCDGSVDEALVRACYSGPAGTEGVGACAAGTQTCSAGEYGACAGDVLPSTETCDAIDNDCDGSVDEALVRACYTGPGGTEDVGACVGGTQTCSAGAYGICAGEITPAAETCDAIDNDCDGSVDENVTRTCYSGAPGTEHVGVCVAGTQACAAGVFGTCEGEVNPSAETCDALDNDCDGQVDEALVRACYTGPEGTEGTGACTGGTETCSAGAYGACDGQVLPAVETCDAVDNDCDGEVDEALVRACYSGPSGTEGVGVCAGGSQTCSSGAYGACVGEVTPTAEVCDAIDNDCDGSVDQALVRACYPGPAGTENVGLCSSGSQTCSVGEWGGCGGYTLPQEETCDEADNNCDGRTDENITRVRRSSSDQEMEILYRPVDIIIVIDNSGSMTDEIVAIENNINNNFASILDASGVDYRVIMIAKHGKATVDQSICVRSPLSGNGPCSTIAACPTNGPRFFQYSYPVGSHDSFAVALDTFNRADPCGLAPDGWSGWLREGAKRVFVEITDDGPTAKPASSPNSMTATQFESRLFALDPTGFGTAEARDYGFHSIIGLKENSPRLAAWQPSDPIVTDLCTANGGFVKQPGAEFQKLSIWTGGLRFPICEYQSFDTIFHEVANGIITSSQMSCLMKLGNVPPGSSLDSTTLEFVPTNGGQTLPMQRVSGPEACSGNSFYVEGTALRLCPEACSLWRGDPTAYVDVLFECRATR